MEFSFGCWWILSCRFQHLNSHVSSNIGVHRSPSESLRGLPRVNWRVTVTRNPSGVCHGWTEESPLHGIPQESAMGELKSHRYTESLKSLPWVNWRVTVTRNPSRVCQGWTEESLWHGVPQESAKGELKTQLNKTCIKDPGNSNIYQSAFILYYSVSPQLLVSLTKGAGDGMQYA